MSVDIDGDAAARLWVPHPGVATHALPAWLQQTSGAFRPVHGLVGAVADELARVWLVGAAFHDPIPATARRVAIDVVGATPVLHQNPCGWLAVLPPTTTEVTIRWKGTAGPTWAEVNVLLADVAL